MSRCMLPELTKREFLKAVGALAAVAGTGLELATAAALESPAPLVRKEGDRMSGIAAQLYTVREFLKTPEDIARTLKKVASLGYKSVQASGLGPIEPGQLKRIADDVGLSICATHISFDRMRNEPQKVIDEHHLLECKYAGLGSMPAPFRNADGYVQFAKEASAVAKRLAEGGITFVYHNHSFELEKYGERTGLATLFEESDSEFFKAEIDTYWIQHGGGDPSYWITKLSSRLPVIHLKDMTMSGSTQIMAEVGEGNLNWPSILNACASAGVEWYVVEQDTCQRDPFESLAISLRNLRRMGKALGNDSLV
jgi:sugar phosphate isomerase/epimerase